MIERLNSLVVCLLFILMATNAEADSCANSVASNDGIVNQLFVEAAKLAHEAEKKKDQRQALLKNALNKLDEIIDYHPRTDLAVKLVSGQSIGEISMAGLKQEIEDLSQTELKCCQCKSPCKTLCGAIDMALGQPDDAVYAAVVRKLVRRDEFQCAIWVSDKISDEKDKKSIQKSIQRAWVRSTLLTGTDRCSVTC